jgi:hypothetical protein
MGKYWFKPKKYGWGIGLPITWEGWIAVLCFVLSLLIVVFINDMHRQSVNFKNVLVFALHAIMLSALFLLLFKKKVEGGVKWRWGEKNK